MPSRVPFVHQRKVKPRVAWGPVGGARLAGEEMGRRLLLLLLLLLLVVNVIVVAVGRRRWPRLGAARQLEAVPHAVLHQTLRDGGHGANVRDRRVHRARREQRRVQAAVHEAIVR